MFENLIKKAKEAATHEYSLNIGGMKCENCAKKITSLLEKIPGIEKAVASVKDGKIDFFGRTIDAVPMIGVIGAATAPADGEIDTETPHKHAGFDFKGLIEKK